MKKIIICSFFFLITPIFLIISFFCFSKFSGQKSIGNVGQIPKVLGMSDISHANTTQIYAPSSETSKLIAFSFGTMDARPIIVETYLKKFNSPLLPFAGKIVTIADNYNIDPFLVVAIAQQESNLGKKSPENCYNAWGWGIHSKGTKCYENWEEAIESVTSGIAKNYCAKGYCEDVCVMMKKYTPGSNGSWCFGVNHFLADLQTGSF